MALPLWYINDIKYSVVSPINDFPRSTCTFRHLTVSASSLINLKLFVRLKDIIKEVQFPKPKPSRSWADTGDKALNFKVTKYVQWIANFGIWKWCREPGDRHQRAGDNDDGPTPAPWSGPEEFDTNINRSPGPGADSPRARSSHLHLHGIFLLITMPPIWRGWKYYVNLKSQ